MQDKQKETFTLDDSTSASNPGCLQVDFFYYFRFFPHQLTQLVFPYLGQISLTIFINYGFVSALIDTISKGKTVKNLPFAFLAIIVFDAFLFYSLLPLINKIIFIIHRTKEHFLHGCVNPGIVISHEPALVAVFTDLTTGNWAYPAIKILPQPLERLKDGIPAVGTKLATIALYEGIKEHEHWDDFHPVVINCVTRNSQDIKRVFLSIPEWEWQALEQGLKQIYKSKKPGLYFLKYNIGEFN
jgi:hypothetical protein